MIFSVYLVLRAVFKGKTVFAKVGHLTVWVKEEKLCNNAGGM